MPSCYRRYSRTVQSPSRYDLNIRNKTRPRKQTLRNLAKSRSLSALLSQLLVAYTVEIDNEFELRMAREGFPGAGLSLTLWTNFLQFVPSEGISFGDLAAISKSPREQLKFQLGCLERWGFVKFRYDGAATSAGAKRRGWGTKQGIGLDWFVLLTEKGKIAAEIWPPLWVEIEERWKNRFGDNLSELASSLRKITDQIETDLPAGLPFVFNENEDESCVPKSSMKLADLQISSILSQVLLTFAIQFNKRSRVPLVLCANVIRVLSDIAPVREGELPRLTGSSQESSDIGWRLKPFVILESDPAKRGKLVRLSPRGKLAHEDYYRITSEIEKEWEKKFGGELRRSLEKLLQLKSEDKSLLAKGLVPPEGVARAGVLVPALGRRDVGAAAKKRMKDLADQTKRFIEDPENSLPHYPIWGSKPGLWAVIKN